MKFKWTTARTGLLVIGTFLPISLLADVSRASDWLDRIVITDDGQLLGRVEDLALNTESNSLEYLVISVGSYLVDQNLIAVKPDALEMGDDGVLSIAKDVLVNVPRFDDSGWPDEASVFPERPENLAESDTPREETPSAEIIGANKRLTVTGGERSEEALTPPTSSRTVPGIRPKVSRAGLGGATAKSPLFSQFDADKDGYLNRQEIAPHFQPGLKFSDFDLDGNGGLDSFEFDVLQNRE